MSVARNQLCVYCAVCEGRTHDHVIARSFFPKDLRDRIPCVPACPTCNNLKSRLEHYLASVLPFGATHAKAIEVLSTMVPGRLQNNLKLARHLDAGKRYRFTSRDGVSWDPDMTLPLDGEALSRLFHMITRGLGYVEYGLLLPEADCLVHADFVTAVGASMFDGLHAQRGNRTGVKNLGNGIFVYEGVQSFDSPQFTVWRMSLCGAVVSGDPNAPDERVSVVYAITAPRSMPAASRLVEFLRQAA